VSNGITHLSVNLATGVGLTLFALNYGFAVEVVNGVVVGCFMATAITPDADLTKSLSHSIMRTLPLFEWLWHPYAKLVPHRSFWSHSLIISTVGRFLYFLLTISPVLIALLYFKVELFYLDFLVGVFVAWVIQDATHFLLDGILLKKW
jgi:uncharacterized metal-binding protein